MTETYRVRTDGAIVALYAGALLVQSVTAVPGALRLVYDGIQVKVLNDGVQLIATAAAAGQLLFPKVVPFNIGVLVYDIAIGPAGLQPAIGTNIVDNSSGAPAIIPRADLITALGTAAAINGQGALATQNDVASVIGPPSITLAASSAGILEGAAPYGGAQFQLYENGAQVTAGITWEANGNNIVTSITGSGTGFFNVTSLNADSTGVTISAARAGQPTKYFTIKVAKSKAAPPVGGAGGTGTSQSQTSGFTAYASAAASVISGELTITVGSGANVTLASAFENYAAAGGGHWLDRYQWQRWNGSAFVTVGATFDASVSQNVHTNGYTDGEGFYNPPTDEQYPGSVSNSQSFASTAGATEKVRLTGFHLAAGSTNTTKSMIIAGQISAQG